MPTRPIRGLFLSCAAFVLTLTTSVTSAEAAPAAVTHHTGTLADGAGWISDTPADWNGTLLVFSHGFGSLAAQDAPTADVQRELLARGYALAGSSYDPNGSLWALNSAERDQFATIDAFRREVGGPRRIISVGQSMGGLVNAQIARDGAGRIDGALGFCGLVAGGVDLDNYQLDAEYAIAALLDPDDTGALVGFSGPDDADALAGRLTAAVARAQATAEGRARIALAAAYLNLADWAPGQEPPAAHDYAGQETQQYAWLAQGLLHFIVSGRYAVEQSAGGNTSWNRGVDYAELLDDSSRATQVKALYRASGLDLRKDLDRLTHGADITADPAAVRKLEHTSTASQGLAVPLLDVHTSSDQLVPVEQENVFAARVRAAGNSRQLRQAYVSRQGHCNFTTAEAIASLHALEHRIGTGAWGSSTDARQLQNSATALGLDGAAFTSLRPAALVGVRRTHG
ncbi:alpha/beta hydrolase [Streptomyces sp. NPDC050738]|uniref:alpha/beta hydrolase n=1 Tax=Streptomyces sp. NPDC050738 TaxID=3154744 RepID=UPI00341B64F6